MSNKSIGILFLFTGLTVASVGSGPATKQDGRDAAPRGEPGRPKDFAKPGGFGPGPKGPGGFGPGMFLGPQVMEIADADEDGRLTSEEAGKAAEAFVRQADAAKKGSIDADALGQAINGRMGPPPGFGPGGPMGAERKLVKRFDRDGNGRLGKEERKAARASIKEEKAKGGGRGGLPPMGMFGGGGPKGKPGPKVGPGEVESFDGKPLYDPSVVRTIFLDFEDADWEAEMADFYKSDVEMPATLTVDGKKYPNVGVHFRGLSSFFTVPAGSKRSLNVSLDFVAPAQRLDGYKTLNLLNSHEDPTFLHTVLYFDVARRYIPAPKANFVKVVINGESWGVYVNAQQFDKKFLSEWFPNADGARWKVKGSPGGGGGLEDVGDKVDDYKARYEIKSKDDAASWKALIKLCKTLSETPVEKLPAAIEPILDVEGALWFLALENALINSDGYWIRASDYSLYRDTEGKFHVIPHDANEAFQPAMAPGMGGPPGGGMGGRGGPGGFMGMGGGPRGSGLEIDPLIGLDDPRKPLRSKLLAVPAYRAIYLEHVRAIARDWLDWAKLRPVVEGYRATIDAEIEADTRKLSTYEDFHRSLSVEPEASDPAPANGRPHMSLKEFAVGRRKYLLDHPEIEKLNP